MRRYRRWTETEVTLLQMAFGKAPIIRIAIALDRTPDAIRAKASELGMKCDTFWTKDKDDLLANLYRDHGSAEIAEIMGRSRYVVDSRIKELRRKGDGRFPYKRKPRIRNASYPDEPEQREAMEAEAVLQRPVPRDREVPARESQPEERAAGEVGVQQLRQVPGVLGPGDEGDATDAPERSRG